MNISISWLKDIIKNSLRDFITEEVTSEFVLKNNLSFAYDIIGKPVSYLPKLKRQLKKLLLEAHRLQMEIPDITFIKTFTLLPMLHKDLDLLTINTKRVLKVVKDLGYKVKKIDAHSITLVKNSSFELDMHFSINILGTELNLNVKSERLRHEYYDALAGEDLELQVLRKDQASLVYYLGLLDSKIIRIADILELSILEGSNMQTLIKMYGLPRKASSYPTVLSPKAYIPIIPIVIHKPNPLDLMKNFIDYIKCLSGIVRYR